MPTQPISVLLIGAGSRGQTVYGNFAAAYPDLVKVVAVAEPKASRRDALARQHNIAEHHQFEDWKEALEQPKLAQVAVVATNDRDHVGPAVAALERGYHLLLEKPMAPSLEDCRRIVSAAESSQSLSAVCHVLRYTPYFQTLRKLIAQGEIGRVISIRHLEPVNYWHFAHSFVRGNWRDSETTSPFLLAKCCHDMDILLYLSQETPRSIQSFGSLSHFVKDQAPENAAERCLDCSLVDTCTYSARRFYGDMLAEKKHWWPLDVVTSEFTEPALNQALRSGPYGRCVYACDNNVCDHQVVNLEFHSGMTASMVATAFTEHPARETEIYGAHGCLKGDGHTIVHRDFRQRSETVLTVESEGHHLGGDQAMLEEFFTAVRDGDPSRLSTTPAVSYLSHQMALLAEKSRLERRLVKVE